MPTIRQPVVAGKFYPNDPNVLQQSIQSFFEKADKTLPVPKAIIAPHAGYVFSGPIAASAYACLVNQNNIQHVAVIAPSHRYPFSGVAVSLADFFATPLGNISVAKKIVSEMVALPEVNVVEKAFEQEHSLEVHLPFLQMTLKDFALIPMLVGQISFQQLAKVLETIWNGSETLIVISSDLTHYLSYAEAQKIDKKTADAIVSLNPNEIGSDQACGRVGIKALLEVAQKKNLKPQLIDLRNSGDTAGPKDRVVGYGAFHFYS